jgi:hypothetical protein
MSLYMASEHTSLKLYQGWITEASVEDEKPPAMDTRPRVFISYSHDSDEHRPNHMATLSVPDQEKVAKRTLHNLVRCSRTGGRGVRRRGQKRSVRRIGWMTRGLLWDGAPHRCVWRAGENDCGRFFEELL